MEVRFYLGGEGEGTARRKVVVVLFYIYKELFKHKVSTNFFMYKDNYKSTKNLMKHIQTQRADVLLGVSFWAIT